MDWFIQIKIADDSSVENTMCSVPTLPLDNTKVMHAINTTSYRLSPPVCVITWAYALSEKYVRLHAKLVMATRRTNTIIEGLPRLDLKEEIALKLGHWTVWS